MSRDSSRSLFGATALLALAAAWIGCATQPIDPHTPGDRCLYSCPNGMVCSGTTYQRGRANPGHCELAPNRCAEPGDCRPRERCVRPGSDVGVCKPDRLL